MKHFTYLFLFASFTRSYYYSSNLENIQSCCSMAHYFVIVFALIDDRMKATLHAHAVTRLSLNHKAMQRRWRKEKAVEGEEKEEKHDRSTPVHRRIELNLSQKYKFMVIVLENCLWDADKSMIDWNLSLIFSTKDIASLLQLYTPGVVAECVCWFSFLFHRFDNDFRLKYVIRALCMCLFPSLFLSHSLCVCVSRFKIECAIIYLFNAHFFSAMSKSHQTHQFHANVLKMRSDWIAPPNK